MKTITIIENNDGSETIYMYNMNDQGEEVVIPNAKTKFNFEYFNEINRFGTNQHCEFSMSGTGKFNKSGVVFTVKETKQEPKNLSSDELLSELKSRISK